MIYTILKKTNVKDRIFRNLLSNPARGKEEVSKKKFSKKFMVTESEVDGFPLVTIVHPSSDSSHIFFLHGGGYFAEATGAHRKLIEKLVEEHHFKVSFIAYPLAPEHRAAYTIEIVEKAFLEVRNTFPEDTLLLFGDSAGGGLALALLQRLKEKQAPHPQKTVLFSPWLDATLSNPGIEEYIEKDVLLQFEGLKECGRIYAGAEGPGSPIPSPINGDLNELGEILVFVSDHEILYPDCLLLEQRAAEAIGTAVEIRTAHKMMHDWVIFPIKEARTATMVMVDFFRS